MNPLKGRNKMSILLFVSQGEKKLFSGVYSDDNLLHDYVGLQCLVENPATHSHCLGKPECGHENNLSVFKCGRGNKDNYTYLSL